MKLNLIRNDVIFIYQVTTIIDIVFIYYINFNKNLYIMYINLLQKLSLLAFDNGLVAAHII